jgi:excinuclease UvrABC ATPase subunit
VVAAGTPAEVAGSSASRTAPYLERFLERGPDNQKGRK